MKSKLLIFCVTCIILCTCSIPDYIKVCPQSSENLAECIIASIYDLKGRLKEGIKELNIPSIEPLLIDRLAISAGQSALSTNMTNLKISGASEFEIIKLVPTLTKKGYTFKIEARIPTLHIEGDYEINTKLLQLELNGKGPFTADIYEYHFECLLKGRKTSKNGETHLIFAKMQCNSVIKKSSVYLHNLFGGNPVLEKAANQAISENSDVLYEDIRPGVSDAIREKLTEIANQITLSFKYDELFP